MLFILFETEALFFLRCDSPPLFSIYPHAVSNEAYFLISD